VLNNQTNHNNTNCQCDSILYKEDNIKNWWNPDYKCNRFYIS